MLESNTFFALSRQLHWELLFTIYHILPQTFSLAETLSRDLICRMALEVMFGLQPHPFVIYCIDNMFSVYTSSWSKALSLFSCSTKLHEQLELRYKLV